MEFELLFLLFSCYISLIQCDFAPGVPPRQEDTIKFHEPTDFQQPQQQQQQQQQKQQQPHAHGQDQGQAHGHKSKHKHGAKINFDADNADHAREHMKHHNREEYVDVDKLSQPQLIMQHFRNFDLDKNGYIDGLEILKAAIRMNEEHTDEDYDDSTSNIDEMAEEADETLAQYDENNDGKIHYGEFYRKHKKILDDGGSAEPNTFTQNAELNTD